MTGYFVGWTKPVPAYSGGECDRCGKPYSVEDKVSIFFTNGRRGNFKRPVAHAGCVLDISSTVTIAEAKRTAEKIRKGMENYVATMALVARAWSERHWVALGYKTWDAYVRGEFGPSKVKLGKDERKHWTQVLHEDAGMPTRAIASVQGVDQKTVVRDLNSVEANASPQPTSEVLDELTGQTKVAEPKPGPKVVGADGKSYAAKKAHRIATVPQAAKVAVPTSGEVIDKLDAKAKSAKSAEATDSIAYWLAKISADERIMVAAKILTVVESSWAVRAKDETKTELLRLAEIIQDKLEPMSAWDYLERAGREIDAVVKMVKIDEHAFDGHTPAEWKAVLDEMIADVTWLMDNWPKDEAGQCVSHAD